MALSNRKLIGTWKNVPGSIFQARTFDNGVTFYLCQIGSEFPDNFVVRGRALASNTTDFTLASGVTTDDIAQLVASDTAGLTSPSGFVVPAGYVKKFGTDGTPYYVNSDDLVGLAGDTNGDGVVDAKDTAARSANIFTSVIDWAKANPMLAVGAVVAIYLFIIKPMMGGKKKKGLLALL